ncbi:MAG: hypothetical protein Q8P21_01255 [bacterium]|nr:hypothetical protein [bacterium]
MFKFLKLPYALPLVFVLVFGLFSSVKSLQAIALIDLGAGAGVNTNTSGTSSDVNVNVDAGADATVDTSVLMDADVMLEGRAINVTRTEVERDVEDEAGGGVSMESQAVLTNGDLRAYALGAIRSDASVEEMNFTGDSVEVIYKQKGRLLALVPITFNVRAIARADGTVEVRYPWYSFLTVDNREEIEAQVKVAVDTALRARTVGSVQAEGESENPSFTAAEKAAVSSRVHTVLKSTFENEGVVDSPLE